MSAPPDGAVAPLAGARPFGATRRTPAFVREQLPLAALVALFVAAGYVAQAALHLAGAMDLLLHPFAFRLFVVTIALPLPFAFVHLRLTVKGADGRWLPGRAGWALTWRRFRERYLNGGAVAAALLAGLAVAVVINLFGIWKIEIAAIHPFAWDVRLSELDRAIHGGRLPWQWLQPMLGAPQVSAAIEALYYAWLPLMVVVCAWQAWSPRRELRLRFFIAFFLTLVLLGDVAAAVFSSAGPCYYAQVAGTPDPYASLFAYHAHVASLVPFGTPAIQADLWRRHLAPATAPFTGVSAFPSIHVAVAVLYTLLGWSVRRPLGILFGAYALAVVVGSVHLGWHYAVDGYASIVGVAVIWWLSGIMVRRFSGAASRD